MVHAGEGEPPDTWLEFFMEERYQTPLDLDINPHPPDEWLTPEELALNQDRCQRPTVPEQLQPIVVVPPSFDRIK